MGDVNLNQLVTEVTDLYRAQVAGRGVALEVRLEPAVKSIVADRGRLRQLLHNLLTNSVEALEGQPDGAISVATRLAMRNGEEVAEIVVEDNGPGFQRELIGQVFDPYVTTKPRGTGLGLAIVRKIVEEHGGHVEADNRADGGARVRIALPLNETTRAQAVQREARRPEARRERA
jgi:nitrogen fixation/metabolism regulation signal transduction histidine kinase